ncbi:MAG: hypothetical protein NUV76_03360, partial [Candidatus Kuenenia sp.]|nr:hypothetical protein [Candidatus Kuenenia sp.]
MALSPITTDSGNTVNSSGFSAENFTEETSRIKERLKAEEKNVEREPATKKEIKTAGDEKKIKNEARATEETEKEEKNRRINDWQRHRDEEAKETENREQARVTQ